MECQEVFERLHEEQLVLERQIDEMRDATERSRGGIREYRRQRLIQLLAVYHGLQQRVEALDQHAASGFERVVFEAEKLWRDIRNAVTSNRVSMAKF